MEELITKLSSSDTGRIVLRVLAESAGEGSEELLSDLLDPFAKLIYNDQAVKEAWENRAEYGAEMLHDYLIGAAVGCFVSSADAVTGQGTVNNGQFGGKEAETAQNQNVVQSAEQTPKEAQNPTQTESAAQGQKQTDELTPEQQARYDQLRQAAEEMELEVVSSEESSQSQPGTVLDELSPEQQADYEQLKKVAQEMGYEIVSSEETSQPVQRKAWEDLSPEMQADITDAILQYADANDNMGQGATRLFDGDEAFVRAFYDAYLQEGDALDMWDAPTVDIQKLAAQLDGIQGIEVGAEQENVDGNGGLENLEKNDIFKAVSPEPVPVTDEAIQRVSRIHPEGWNDIQAEKLQLAAKDFLRSVQEQGELIEYGAAYTMDMQMIDRQQTGTKDSVNIPRSDTPYITVHNHPHGETFSSGDIQSFVRSPRMELMVVVGNDGATYSLQKTESYDVVGFQSALREELTVLKKIENEGTVWEYIDEMNRFLKEETEQYGIKFVPGN